MNDFLSNWKQVNELTLDFLKKIPEKEFSKKPFDPRFKSLAWEFACILSTRAGYIKGFALGSLDGSCFSADTELSKKEFLKKLEETSKKILDVLNNQSVDEIIYFGEKTSKENVISWLMQHEQFHFGKLLLYFSKAEIELPSSLLKMWGENSFRKK
ncbi:DinB family protein [Candidatus Pacearchaeota archaeon]|nr:DinB family protein [Candidatus Pacearchaeota archaeon]